MYFYKELKKLNTNISAVEIGKWFKGQGFKLVQFNNGKTHISSYWDGQMTSVKLKQKAGFDTYFKKAYGGALIVYDITIHNNILMYEGYCPIWLFGIWNKKIAFKKSASGIFKYRSEGFIVEEKFKRFLAK